LPRASVACCHEKHLAALAEQSFELKRFEDIAYAEPTYYKEFHSTAKADKA
jgi:hypothetical protein